MAATITLGELLEGHISEAQSKQCIYLVHKGKRILYVGKTERATVQQRFLDHMGQGRFPANLVFDKALKEAMPGAKRWQVDILERDDWNAVFDAEGLPRRYKLNTAESALIRLFKPKYNITSHPDHKRPLPWVKDHG